VTLVALGPVAPALAGDAEAGKRKAEVCAACHGPHGNATIPGTPSLAGHPAYYTHWQLIMFRNTKRKDSQMQPIAERLSDDDMADLAEYYAAQASEPRPGRPTIDAATREAGEQITSKHHCTSCHGPGLAGQEAVPRLVGQDQQYLMKRLRGYKTQTTSDLDGQMTSSAQALTGDDIEVLARYIAALPLP
jgi:cytochrome c553